MRHRPMRNNYPNGKFGEIDYQDRLESYCTYLESKLAALNKVASSQPIIESYFGFAEYLKDYDFFDNHGDKGNVYIHAQGKFYEKEIYERWRNSL